MEDAIRGTELYVIEDPEISANVHRDGYLNSDRFCLEGQHM